MQENVNVNENEMNENEDYSVADVLKANKSTIDQLQAELKSSKKRETELAKALMNNDYATQTNNTVDLRSAKDIAEEFLQAAGQDDMRKSMELALEYREARIKESKIDPFVNNNPKNPPSSADYADADAWAESIKECLDNSESDSDFKLEYNRNFK